MEEQRLRQFIENQVKSIETIQKRIDWVIYDCPPDELAALTQALNNAVNSLSALLAMMPPAFLGTMPPTIDEKVQVELKKEERRYQLLRDDFDKAFDKGFG